MQDIRTSREESRPCSILIVDDEALIRDLVAHWLAAAGYECQQAATANEAWDRMAQRDISLIVLDINMPGWSGLELLSRVKKDYANTEVVMLTAANDAKTAIKALSGGAASYLVKPIDSDELLLHVRNALERRQLVMERNEYMLALEQRVREQTAAIRRAHEETIHRLVTASLYRDEETGAHIRRVGMYSALFADALGWPLDEVECIRMAAPMHDIGKIGIPDAVLRKPGRLTPAEFEIMKQHTIIGAEMLSGSDSPILQLASQIARCHHERWDGKGYPIGLAGEAIPEAARIVAIADVYDALTHDRVYRSALPEENALERMEEGWATHFDPCLLRLFMTLLPEFRNVAKKSPDEVRSAHYLDAPGEVQVFSTSPLLTH